MISDSIKAKDPMKVGRFGLGFKSVFHLTGKNFYLRQNDHTRLYETEQHRTKRDKIL